MEAQAAIKCPECGGRKVHHSGKRLLSNREKVQYFECVDCGRKFPEDYIRKCLETDEPAHYAQERGDSEKMSAATENKTVTGDTTERNTHPIPRRNET